MERFSEFMDGLINDNAKKLSDLNNEELIMTTLQNIAGHLVEKEHREKTGASGEMLASCSRAIRIKLKGETNE